MLVPATCVAAAVLLWYAQRPEPEPILGVYRRRGKWYWLKYALFLALYYFRKTWHRNKAASTPSAAGQGVKALADPARMERAQLLSDDAKAFDAVFFIGAKEGHDNEGIYFQAGVERRQMGICNGLFYLGLPGKGLLCSQKLPDTMLFGAEANQFGAEGLLMEPLEPMQTWRVTYNGEMWSNKDRARTHRVQFRGEWRARWRYFDYDSDLHAPAVARSIATQPWSRDYFDRLRTAHQSHYEQFGELSAEVVVDGEQHSLTLPAFRDHSFGSKRDWSLMHRYVFHHIFLEDDTCISVGVICQPSTTSLLEAGVVCGAGGRVTAVEWCDLQLYQHGEAGAPPAQYAFRLGAGGREYTVQVFVEHDTEHYKGWDWEARLVELFCRYDVDGVPGRGSSEWQYAHRAGRPAGRAAADPEWYRKYCHEP